MTLYTPWGPSQHTHRVADGIVFHHTASHGGYHLSGSRVIEFYSQFPDFHTYSGAREWFEEDSDAAAVVLAFPQHFNDHQIRDCIISARHSARPFNFGTPDAPKVERYPEWESIVTWLDGNVELKRRAEEFERQHANEWESGSCGGPVNGYPPHSWWVSLTRVGDGARRDEVLCEYPKRFYTDAELALAIAERLPKPLVPAFRETDCGGVLDCVGTVCSDADPGL